MDNGLHKRLPTAQLPVFERLLRDQATNAGVRLEILSTNNNDGTVDVAWTVIGHTSVTSPAGQAIGAVDTASPAAPVTEPRDTPTTIDNVPSSWSLLIRSYRTRLGVTTSLKIATLSQWILESGRGGSDLARAHLNFGGLKFRARMTGHATPVDVRGSDGELATYCAFASVEAFIEGYWHFIRTGPYEGWDANAEDGAGFIRHLAARGYAADPDYVPKVLGRFAEASQLLDVALESGELRRPETGAMSGRLAIVVGHNRVAQGATALQPIGRSEFVFNSLVAQEMRSAASGFSLEVEVFFREAAASTGDEIRDAYAKVSKFGPDAVIELHFNSSEPTGTGTEMLIRSRGTGSAGAPSLAARLQAECVSLLGLPDRRVKERRPGDRGALSLFALDNVPTVLAESFFGSSARDCLKMAAAGEHALATAYLRAVRDWMGSHF